MPNGKAIVYNGQVIGTPSGAVAIENLVAENIKSGVNVGGVVGNFEGGTGNPFSSNVCVNFYSPIGELKLQIPVTSLPLNSLPNPPQVEGYTITWANTLAKVNAMTKGGDVICSITPNSLTPTILYPTGKGFSGVCSLYANFNYIEIDWGDGNKETPTNGSQQVSHTFSNASYNPIKLTPLNSSSYLQMGYNGTAHIFLEGNLYTQTYALL